MPININHEELLSLGQAAKALPSIDGKNPHKSSIWRWITKGLGEVRLEHVRVGRRVCTSREALNRFVNALANHEARSLVASVKATNPQSSKKRLAQIKSAEITLQKAGL